ncbi:hypothetical protein [Streptomyces sp. Tu 6176]|uniref:hypothetical protein n=1 Tax=Streptomyces sp. Tu 6176 TaxID=1470557 RepID=UPI000563CBE9|nr:hypothetical protein [Streptomyces sp. Tu 6176]
MTSPFISTRRRQLVGFGAIVGLCLFAWWAVQPVGDDCPTEGLTLSSDPYGSTYDPAEAKGTSTSAAFGSGGDDAPCQAETQHPRLYGWLGL